MFKWMHPSDLQDPASLVDFHTRHKLLLMAHSPNTLRVLGRLVASAGAVRSNDFERLACEYGALFRQALAQTATRGGHVNALQHMAGYLRRLASPREYLELTRAIEDFACGRSPLAHPVALVRRLAAAHAVGYLLNQVYPGAAGPAG